MTNPTTIARSLREAKQMEKARKFAEWALADRLKMGAPPEKNDRLRVRIAAIRGGQLDTAPEVQSALYAVRAAILAEQDTP